MFSCISCRNKKKKKKNGKDNKDKAPVAKENGSKKVCIWGIDIAEFKIGFWPGGRFDILKLIVWKVGLFSSSWLRHHCFFLVSIQYSYRVMGVC